jgi:two-component system LytT family response regulator
MKMKDTIVISDNEKSFMFHTSNIGRLEAKGLYTIIHLKNKMQHVGSGNIDKFHKKLDKDIFYRIHNSHVVNIHEIEIYYKGKGGSVTMSDKSIVPVSYRRKTGFKKHLKANGCAYF